MPKKIRELKQMLLKAGFELLPGRGKGSHCVYKHPLLARKTTIAGKDGQDSKRYQELEVKQIIEEVKELEEQ
jgi:predicted RNA binding protein YcfA (HicA-like mRNA interferase family)